MFSDVFFVWSHFCFVSSPIYFVRSKMFPLFQLWLTADVLPLFFRPFTFEFKTNSTVFVCVRKNEFSVRCVWCSVRSTVWYDCSPNEALPHHIISHLPQIQLQRNGKMQKLMIFPFSNKSFNWLEEKKALEKCCYFCICVWFPRGKNKIFVGYTQHTAEKITENKPNWKKQSSS